LTEVAFHFNAPDKQAYVCRLARKALRHRARLVILGAPQLLKALSPRLWSVSPTDFLAHAGEGDGAALMAFSPIVLLEQRDAAPHHDTLVNLGADVPPGFERFARVVEVVSASDEEDRQLARLRWKHYAAQGIAIKRHDLVLKE
jgi:DNA polymerase-3 subunit chi